MEVIIYSIASLIGLSAFFLTNVLWIRIVFTIATLLFVISGILFHIYSIAIWNAFYSLVNIFQIVLIFIAKKPILLPKNLVDLYEKFSKYVTTREFMYLIKNGEIKQETDIKLYEENDHLNKLFLLIEGNVNIEKNKTVIANLKTGQFIGEMCYLKNEPISTSFKALGNIQYITWSYKNLKKIKQKKPDLYTKFLYILCDNLLKKIPVPK